MAKRCATLVASLVLLSSAVGCCCGYGRSNCSPCATGGCSPSYYPPGGTGYYQGYGSTAYNGGATFGQTAFLGEPTVVSSAPVVGAPYTSTALAPINTLPAY